MFMDLPTLPTNRSDSLDNGDPSSTLNDNAQMSGSNVSVPDSTGLEQLSTEPDNSTQTIDPSAIILAEALTDKAISWQMHNCKIIKKTVTQDLPLPFLYHYDSLDDAIKQTHPLTPELLIQYTHVGSSSCQINWH